MGILKIAALPPPLYARRGYPDTPEAGTWVPIEPGWEVKDVLGGDEIWVRYTNPVSGEVITFPEGGANDHNG
jgi:hypothetical protein